MESKRCCSCGSQHRKRACKLGARVCVQVRKGDCDRKILSLNQLAIIGWTETSPCHASSKPTEELEEL